MTTQQKNRSGLVLLVVLGMLGLFSLLAITYLSISGSSRSSSQALVLAKLQNVPTSEFSEDIIRKIVRGDRNVSSAFHGHSLLEDVYGRDAIEGTFATTTTIPAQIVTLNLANTTGFVSVNLNPRVTIKPDTMRQPAEIGDESFLSDAMETYTGRLLTVLDGPLKGQTYRILSYTGLESAPNFAIIIDLSETVGGTAVDLPAGAGVTGGETLQNIISSGLVGRLFTTSSDEAYSFVINDLPFNGLGYGVELDPRHPNYGNLDQSRLVPGAALANTMPTPLPLTYAAGQDSFPLVLLPNYDYLSSTESTGSLGIGQNNAEVNGSTNEGSDVADFRDYFLAGYREASQGTGNLLQSEIIPSFHRPELVNYIFQYYGDLLGGNLGSMTQNQLTRMITLIDYACARPLSYRIRNGTTDVLVKNPNFTGRSDNFAIPSLDIDLTSWANASEQNKLREWVKALIAGGPDNVSNKAWDVDNDNDITADSVWVDPGLPIIKSSNGKYLKVLAATLILDMDSRINVNVVGDRNQINFGAEYRTKAQLGNDLSMSRVDIANSITSVFLPQGVGYGPADIAINRLFGNNSLSILNSRYRINESPSSLPGNSSNDLVGQYLNQRGMFIQNDGRMIGLGQARRSRTAMGVDNLGNLRMSDADVITYPAEIANDVVNDTYEVASLGQSGSDDPYDLSELESILRRFDQDVGTLPDRLKTIVSTNVNTTSAVYKSLVKSITTRSVELRHPNLAAVSLHQSYGSTSFPRVNFQKGSPQTVTASSLPVPVIPLERFVTNGRIEGSMMRWIQLLHAERFPTAVRISISNIRRLFPIEFQKLSRLDLNRTFGNGQDGTFDGQIDEPFELGRPPATYNEGVAYPGQTTTSHSMNDYGFQYSGTTAIPGVSADQKRVYVTSLDSRKVFARQMYCLAQLLVAPDYPFGGINQSDGLVLYQSRRARELAQWAINIVDFRDNDAAMTRFEYDINPFLVDSGDMDVWEPNPGDVVWGMEFPEVVLTETLAFHDKRLKNTRNDPSGRQYDLLDPTNSDPSTDQYRTPQGSLFIELFCPRSTETVIQSAGSNLGLPPTSLYNGSLNPTNYATPPNSSVPATLDLARRAPDAIDATNQSGLPVFRIGISEPYRNTPNANEVAIAQHPTNATGFAALHNQTFQTSEFASTQSGTNPFTTGLVSDISMGTPRFFLDRVIWFADVNASALTVPDLRTQVNRQYRVYYNNTSSSVALNGGQYLVVGPRSLTRIGSLTNPPPDLAQPAFAPSLQNINFAAPNMLTDLTGVAYSRPMNAGTPLTMVASTVTPPGWPGRIGVNISEPNPTPVTHYGDTASKYRLDPSLPNDIYTDPASVSNSFPDIPFDYDPARNPVLARSPVGSTDPDDRKRTATYMNERVAYLQRLADPQLPYHEIFNPYITIDWMAIDLSVFNGEDTLAGDPDEGTAPNPVIAFQSRFKDGARISDLAPNGAPVAPLPAGSLTRLASNTTTQTGVSVFSASTAPVWRSAPMTGTTTAYFEYELGHANAAWKLSSPHSSVSLGYLNVGRQNDLTNPLNCDGFGIPAASTAGSFQGSP